MKIILKSVKIIILAVIIGTGSIYVFAAAWVGPSVSPTGGNIPAPINATAGTQTKSGNLIIQGYLSAQGFFESSRNAYLAIRGGGVGIGVINPVGKLDVRGDEVRIWDGSASVRYANSEGELYVENDMEVDGRICLSGDCRSNWAGGGSPWASSGSDIYYNSGRVGIGTTNPSGNLDVRGGPVNIWDGNAVINDARSEGDLYVENTLEVDGYICLGNKCEYKWVTPKAPCTWNSKVYASWAQCQIKAQPWCSDITALGNDIFGVKSAEAAVIPTLWHWYTYTCQSDGSWRKSGCLSSSPGKITCGS